MKTIIRSSLAALALLSAFASQAASAAPQIQDQYAEMCVKAADFPKPHGESDLKGNPKLGEYCKCFSQKFAARATESTLHPKFSSVEDNVKSELDMRNTCRVSMGLATKKE
jgi:hypothetical protein